MTKKTVCITGGYGRLGQDLAKAFLADGDNVLITGRDKEKLQTAARDLNCDHFQHDVTDTQQTEKLRKHIQHKYERLDVLINNAGVMRSKPVEDMPPDLFLTVVKTNLYGPYLTTHILLPLIKRSGDGLIINVASTSGHRADPGSSAYNASKFGLLGFTEALRKELRRYDIRVTSISPSAIFFGDADRSGKGVGLNGRDIADTAVFLANSPGRALFRDIELWATNP